MFVLVSQKTVHTDSSASISVAISMVLRLLYKAGASFHCGVASALSIRP